MKKLILLLVPLFIVGCAQTRAPVTVAPSTTEQSALPVSQPETTKPLEPVESSDLSMYNKWKLPQTVIENNRSFFKEGLEKSDCVKLVNGITDGGDLLSTLIVDQEARKLMRLSAYSPEYVLKLENTLVGASHARNNMDLYAFSVCHLSDSVDVVAGVLWPKNKPVIQADGKFAGGVDFDFGRKETIAVVSGSSTVFFDDIRTRDNTVTGAEVMPCSASLSDNGKSVLWNCFVGLHINDDGIDGSNMTEWNLPLVGGVATKRDYVNYL